jgi:hypothetical protein
LAACPFRFRRHRVRTAPFPCPTGLFGAPVAAAPGVRLTRHEEFAVTPEKTEQNQLPPESDDRPSPQRDVRNLDVWARSAPIRLAGYEDDPTESHILRSVD